MFQVLHPLEVLTKIGRFLDLKLDDTTNLTKVHPRETLVFN